MTARLAVLNDRGRSQRGSVLSGVLIITAFLAIIGGALMTELSTNFLLSQTHVNRVTNQATVNSAIERALDSLQSTPLINGCPNLSAVTLNGRRAAVSYTGCAPVVDARSPQFTGIANPTAFNLDATHSTIPGSQQDLYLVGDSAGIIYSFNFGQSSPRWAVDLKTGITGPPLAMQDAAASPPDVGDSTGRNADISNLVPIVGGGNSGCSAAFCVELLGEDVGIDPDAFCFMNASARVTSRPAGGLAYPQVAYFGDTGGNLYAYKATELSCGLQAGQLTPNNAAIVAGPVVVQNGTRDEIYVVTSRGSTSQLLRYTYRQSPTSLVLADTLSLPSSNPVGLAVEGTAIAPRIAIAFAGGGVAIVGTNSNFDPSVIATTGIGVGIADAPYWCSCQSGSQIGVAGLNGSLYVLDTSLRIIASGAAARLYAVAYGRITVCVSACGRLKVPPSVWHSLW